MRCIGSWFHLMLVLTRYHWVTAWQGHSGNLGSVEVDRGCSSERLFNDGKKQPLESITMISESACSGLFLCLNLVTNTSKQLFLHPRNKNCFVIWIFKNKTNKQKSTCIFLWGFYWGKAIKKMSALYNSEICEDRIISCVSCGGGNQAGHLPWCWKGFLPLPHTSPITMVW